MYTAIVTLLWPLAWQMAILFGRSTYESMIFARDFMEEISELMFGVKAP